MPTDAEFGDALRLIADWIDQIDGEIIREVEGKLGQSDRDVEGYAVNHGGSTVNVFGSPDTEYISIMYSFSPIGTIAMSRLRSAVNADSGESATVSDTDVQETRNEAAADIRAHFDDDELEESYYGLFEEVGADDYAIEVRMEDSVIHEVQVSKKLFVYTDRVSLQQFADAMQAVASKGALGNNYLRQAYELDQFVERPDQGPGSAATDQFEEDQATDPELN